MGAEVYYQVKVVRQVTEWVSVKALHEGDAEAQLREQGYYVLVGETVRGDQPPKEEEQ